MKMSENDLVVAINDGPIPKYGFIKGKIHLDRAYKVGDTFRVYRESIEDSSRRRLIIWHPILETEMDVNIDNFMTLSEYRDIKLEELLK